MTVLFCPLDWGLGHIARDLPLIRWFHNQGHKVIIAASPKIEEWLKKECPSIEVTRFQGPEIHYTRHRHLLLKLIFQLPKLMRWPGKEKKRTAELVSQFCPDLIVSDNRYGARHPEVFSAIITHQLMIKMPGPLKWTEWPLHKLIRFLLNKFDEIWVPDFDKKHSLAGDLVHKYPLPPHARLIGPISRFYNPEENTSPDRKLPLKGILAIISGPEPQCSLLEQKIREIAPTLTEKTTLITGNPSEQDRQEKRSNNLKEFPHLRTDALQKSIQSNRVIIARSGYSTIMDMYYLGRRIWLVPTPGQTEQMYLADYHGKKGHYILPQHRIENLKTKKEKPVFQTNNPSRPIFQKVLTDLLNSPHNSSKQNGYSSSKKSFQ